MNVVTLLQIWSCPFKQQTLWARNAQRRTFCLVTECLLLYLGVDSGALVAFTTVDYASHLVPEL